MVIETFKPKKDVYKRAEEKGRMMPERLSI
jgi:hypothetical protein